MEYDKKELNSNEINFLISELQNIVSEVQFSKRLQLRIVNYILLLYAVTVGIYNLNKNYLCEPVVLLCEPVILWIVSLVILILGICLLCSCGKSQENNNNIAKEIRKISETYSEIEEKLKKERKKEKDLQKTFFKYITCIQENFSEYIIRIWIGILILGFIAESWCLFKLFKLSL